MVQYGISQRYVKVSQDEINALSKLEGQRFVEIDGRRRSVTINLWQGRNEQRVYVKVDGDSSYVNAAAAQDNFGFSSPISGRAVVALLEQIAATEAPQEATEEAPQEATGDDLYELAAPTVVQAQTAMDIVGFSSVPASKDAVVRTIQIKGVWQHFVVAPIFKALPIEEQRPYTWNEICLEHDGEFAEILKGVRAGLVSWDDHLIAFSQGVALKF